MQQLSVRELQSEDIPLIADYWLTSEPDFLVGMGVDLAKVPSRGDLTAMLTQQLGLPVNERMSYALIWLENDRPVGHSNVNRIEFGEAAYMHLHLWQPALRQRGAGTELIKKSLPFYFENLQLKTLYCEPYALNPAPNKTLAKTGFEFVKRHTTIPGTINFEQEVNRWQLTREAYEQFQAGKL
ncbi:GNAT family N-acetyltransferase [Pontibacter sp. Tf4]|uniref:GNAT family N-acetyltransferase n=1 Tax=Pontibacter sp. Tf4 TaxID=2761620 RepID=UPI00162413A8|nr:GNAT family protein [Pontibacter sp. Tf4]MBB6612163.1 GNAT family N-acetyltransferase [Pontibacter sp. Tf4]